MNSEEIPRTHLEIKVLSPSKGDSSTDSAAVKSLKRSNEIRKKLFAAFKIITAAFISDDETMEDFISEYENYRIIGDKIRDYGLSEDIPCDESSFASEPPKYWMELLVTVVSALHAYPDNSNICCDVIGIGNEEDNRRGKENGNGINCTGVCYSTMLNIEAFDWKTHSISLFVPFKSEDGLNSVFMVDDAVRLFSKPK